MARHMTQDWDFFLAHASAHTEVAEALYDHLARHARVFLDSRSLQLGDNWDEALIRAQRASTITVVLVSEGTLDAFYQREEVAAAIALSRKNPAGHRVVPIYWMASPERAPYGLRLKHGMTLTTHAQLGEAATKLLELLHSLNGGQQLRLASPLGWLSPRTAPRLRSIPHEQLGAADITLLIRKRGYFEINRNPTASGPDHHYQYIESVGAAGHLIRDEQFRLLWQVAGSEERLPYDEALRYVQQLSTHGDSTENHWRLPTVDEALSLMTREPDSNDLYIDPLFGQSQRAIWTSDCSSARGSWILDFELGYCTDSPQTTQYRFWVRAVQSLTDAS